MILIGSKAIKHWFPDFKREPKDTDYIVHEYYQYNWDKSKDIEYLKCKPISDLYPDNWVTETTDSHGFTSLEQVNHILEPDRLLTLKASHLFWDINWEKHMFDTQFLLKKGCKIDLKLFWKLYSHWNIYHSKNKRSDLKMTKNEFFDNAINYDEGEHDYLHTLINPIPIYTKVLKDNCEVELDENKFIDLSYEDKLDFIKEEVMIMAYERFKNLYDYRKAYSKMLKKFIISHAPLFSLIFIIENYIELLKPKFNYYKKIEDGIKNKCN